MTAPRAALPQGVASGRPRVPQSFHQRAWLWALQFGRTPTAALVSVVSGLILIWVIWHVLDWALLSAALPGADRDACMRATGACWPFIQEKFRFMLFGTFPFDQQWRPALASLVLCMLCVVTGLQAIGAIATPGVLAMTAGWTAGLVFAIGLMAGGMFGLVAVDSVRWNGLPVLLILSVNAIAVAFPIGLLLALARHQRVYLFMQRAAVVVIEVMRGVPMVSVLFVGIFVLPLMLPPGSRIDPIAATLVALALFHAAYFAEDVRGGLQALPKGQIEAAQSLGLGYWQATVTVILPQAVTRSMPALVNSIIGAYKDTSLVVVLGIHDLTATARMAFNDPDWRGHALEAYALVGLWFFLSCAFLSAIGRRLQADQQRKAR